MGRQARIKEARRLAEPPAAPSMTYSKSEVLAPWVAALPMVLSAQPGDYTHIYVTSPTLGPNEIQVQSRLVPFQPRDFLSSVDNAVASALHLTQTNQATSEEFIRSVADRLCLHAVTYTQAGGSEKLNSIGYEGNTGATLEGIGVGPEDSGEWRIMAKWPVLHELVESLSALSVKAIIARQQGDTVKVITLVDPDDFTTSKVATNQWLIFSHDHDRDIQTGFGIDDFEEDVLESYRREGYEVLFEYGKS